MKGAGDKVCCIFTTYNVLATIFGGLVVGVASWLAADKISFFTELRLVEKDKSVSEEFKDLSVIDFGAFILIGIGVAIVIQSILGCTGTILGCCNKRSARTFLIVYGSLVALVVVCEIVAAVLVLYVYKDDIGDEARKFMETTLQDYREPAPGQGPANGVTVIWDQIMKDLQCCGVGSYLDFPNDVPPVCCLEQSGGNVTIVPSSCPTTADNLPTQMTTGCFNVLLFHSVPAIASSLAVVALFQVAGVILSCCLARKSEEHREWYEMRSM